MGIVANISKKYPSRQALQYVCGEVTRRVVSDEQGGEDVGLLLDDVDELMEMISLISNRIVEIENQ
jgi:hypothetical protein